MAEYKVHCGSHRVQTTVTAAPSAVRRWIYSSKYHRRRSLLRGRLVVGLGIQWVPGHDAAATLQLCVGRRCIIFQLSHANHCPDILRRFLADRNVLLVGIANYSDAEMLLASRHGLKVRGLVDIRKVASDLRGCSRSASMGTLASEILGMYDMEKDELVGRSYWDAEQLSTDQVKYACHDVFLASLMANELKVWKWGYNDY